MLKPDVWELCIHPGNAVPLTIEPTYDLLSQNLYIHTPTHSFFKMSDMSRTVVGTGKYEPEHNAVPVVERPDERVR